MWPPHLSRRRVLSGLAGLAGVTAAGLPPVRVVAAPDETTFFARLVDRAAAKANATYKAPADDLPEVLADLTYDDIRDIRFRRDRAIWHGESPFEVHLLHLGHYLKRPVRVHTVENGRVTPETYRPDLFDFGRTGIDASAFGELGFSGLRLMYALNDPTVMDELIVLQGASYFRALCAGAVYGLSARGVAVNTARPDGEEFPAFTELYVERPAAGAESIVLYALLDGPSLAGAYRFEVTPGMTTRTTVQARLFARRRVEQLGMGVLTSMFDFAPVDRAGVEDFRPRVHDSQGLSMRTESGEWLWRPLNNPDRLEVNVFQMPNPGGFGLMQRVRQFDRYQDLEAQYHRRPSAWVTPHGDWGDGAVILVEIPTPDETRDNIVAFWKPAIPFEPGLPLAMDYDIDWTLDGPRPERAWCEDTRAGHYGLPSTELDETMRRLGRKWVIDFVGGPVRNLCTPDDVAVVASVDGGRMDRPVAVLNDHTGGVRVFLDTVANGHGPMNLRCHLARDGAPISETWTMQWRPPAAA
ncbi:glucan biosynthesis protein [Roseospira navarrensis]|uniref:Glucans biosynthesis protein G n=1 Tax=Roseospira navarrensis TaxID=140058 RepID=A0A7X1ZDA4_9PROT|nr:glucan biosynthesis protein G [Roseospira navarrensis]MQX36222.1 glucan biosynthesis protein G [Roseospira navarrensis]